MIHVGDTTDLQHVFRTSSGVAVNPSTVVVDVYQPGDDTSAPASAPRTYTYGADAELTRPETGLHVLTIVLDRAGEWRFRWRATGATVADKTHVETVEVTASVFDTPTVEPGLDPDLVEVAALLLDHRSDAFGKDQRTFTDATKPSAHDARIAIKRSRLFVEAHLGVALSDAAENHRVREIAREAIAVHAAMRLVLYLPEAEPEYERLATQFREWTELAERVLETDTPNQPGYVSVPVTTVTAAGS